LTIRDRKRGADRSGASDIASGLHVPRTAPQVPGGARLVAGRAPAAGRPPAGRREGSVPSCRHPAAVLRAMGSKPPPRTPSRHAPRFLVGRARRCDRPASRRLPTENPGRASRCYPTPLPPEPLRQDHLGHHDHSLLTTFTSHLEAVSCSALLCRDCLIVSLTTGHMKKEKVSVHPYDRATRQDR